MPAIEGDQIRRLRGIFRKGLAQGNRPRSFIKVGDSLSWTALFLQGISCGEQRLGGRKGLTRAIRWFGALRLPDWASDSECRGGGDDPFGRDSAAARPNQFSFWPLRTPPFYDPAAPGDTHCAPTEAPLACEWRLLEPSIALVMTGTNDAGWGFSPSDVRSNLVRTLRWLLLRGTIPVLSTLPPRLDTPGRGEFALAYNVEIRSIGREMKIPLIDTYRAFTRPEMIDQGIGPDGVHPNVLGPYNCPFVYERCASTRFGPNGLRYGHNRRNLIVLQTLERLRARVIAPVLRASRQRRPRPAP